MPNFVHTKVDPNRLSAAAQNIENSLNMIQNALNTVDNALLNTLQPSWAALASTQFFQQYAIDKSAFMALARTVRALNNQLKEAAGVFDRADEKANDLVRKLRIG